MKFIFYNISINIDSFKLQTISPYKIFNIIGLAIFTCSKVNHHI